MIIDLSIPLENDVPATDQTVYRINSVTKAFTATLILQLAENGTLRLDDAERAALAVLANQRDGLRKVRIVHGGHGDQELVDEVWRHVATVSR